DVIVMSQSCDLAPGREKVPEVLLCGLWTFDELQGVKHFQTAQGKEDARRGNMPGFHLISACDERGFESDIRVIDFRRVYTAPVEYLRKRAIDAGPRLRLLPPCREHLSQAFARFFMRVGLPVDIPPFK
ncbi:MAG: hypothetical protein AB7U20_03545, partial [Planctomycetaceae bacterium]